MKQFIAWAGVLIGLGVAAYRAIGEARRRLRNAATHAEAVAGRTRAALAETEAALHETREALS